MTASRPPWRLSLKASRCAYADGVRMESSVVRAAAMVRGLPLKVPSWITFLSSIKAITSARPPMAPQGSPPPMALASAVRSGGTPKRSVAPPGAMGGLDLEDQVAAGEAPGDADPIQGRFGAAVREPPERLVEPAHQLGGDYGVVGHRLGKVGAPGGPFADRLHDLGVGVADHHHPEPVVEVDVLVPVHVPHPAALAPVDKERLG